MCVAISYVHDQQLISHVGRRISCGGKYRVVGAQVKEAEGQNPIRSTYDC